MTENRERVVVGVDGSDCATAALQWAERYAKTRGATLVLVTAWEWPISYGVPIGYDGFDPRADAKHIVDAAAQSLALPADQVERSVVEGMPGDVLVGAAKDAALLVVGTRGHRAITSTLLGSTSNHCAHHARCPVVIVR
jgi:nucleotide-binding universal stress UspA family protein